LPVSSIEGVTLSYDHIDITDDTSAHYI